MQKIKNSIILQALFYIKGLSVMDFHLPFPMLLIEWALNVE